METLKTIGACAMAGALAVAPSKPSEECLRPRDDCTATEPALHFDFDYTICVALRTIEAAFAASARGIGVNGVLAANGAPAVANFTATFMPKTSSKD